MPKKRTPNREPGDEAESPEARPASAVTRRGLLGVLASAAGLTVLSGCSTLPSLPLPAQPTSSPARVQLVYQDWRTEWFPPMAQQMLEVFHADHPNIMVYYTPDPERLEDKMLAAMQAGTASDVFQGCCSFFPVWAQAGYAVDLRPYIRRSLDQATLDDWDPAQFAALATWDGRQFGLPKYHGALGLYFNKDLFDGYGLPYPDASWTYDDYLRTMKLTTKDRDRDGKTDLWGSYVDVSWERIQIHVNSFGGHFVDPNDPTRCMMSEQPVVDALEWLRARMWDDKVIATVPELQNLGTREAFIAGKVAMVEDGSWALKDILSASRFRIGVAPFPRGPVRHATLATSDGFGMYSGCRHKDEAWQLLQFLTSPEYGRAMARAHFLQPARASLVDEWVQAVRKEYPTAAAALDVASFADGQRNGYSVTAEVFARDMAEASRVAGLAFDQILVLGQAPAARMASVCQEIETAVRANK